MTLNISLMITLSNGQILERVQKKPKKAQIQKAKGHEDHLKFHSEICLSESDSDYAKTYSAFIDGTGLPNDKKDQFKKLLTYPLASNELIDKINDEYLRVFEPKDAFIDYLFTDPTLKSDFEKYLVKINDKDFWKNDAFKCITGEVSSLLVIDLPELQTSDRPEPYSYLLCVDDLIDYQIKDNKFEYVIFEEDNILFYYDAFSGRKFIKSEDNWIFQIEVPHDLGWCPVTMLFSELLDDSDLTKLSPLSPYLTQLDWYLFFHTAKKALDLYAAYPIYWSYESKCSYQNEYGSCESGYIRYPSSSGSGYNSAPCPACEKRKLVGPGSLIEKPAPRTDIQMSGDPAGIISIDKSSLDYNVTEDERLGKYIYLSATGKKISVENQAINKLQVSSNYETQSNIINWIARNFEKAVKFKYDTIAKLRYGSQFIESVVNLGSCFYIETAEDAKVEYGEAKKNNYPTYQLLSKLEKLDDIETKNNPSQKARITILRSLEPWINLSLQEAKDLGFDILYPNLYAIKINFITFVNKFERDYGNIVEFGSKLEFNTKIDKINEVFKSYINELKTV